MPETNYTNRLDIEKGSKQGSHQAMAPLLDEYASVSRTDQRRQDMKRWLRTDFSSRTRVSILNFLTISYPLLSLPLSQFCCCILHRVTELRSLQVVQPFEPHILHLSRPLLSILHTPASPQSRHHTMADQALSYRFGFVQMQINNYVNIEQY